MARLLKVWVNQPAIDLVVGLALAALWLIAPAALIGPIQDKDVTEPLISASANVLAVLAAVVTFSCSALYQSRSERVMIGRLLLGSDLRRTWRNCIVASVGSAVISLSALLVLPWSVRLALLILSACVVIATLRTLRAVYWLNLVLAAEDRDLPGLPVGQERFTHH